MSNWEYKVITSGKGGFASPALLEKFLNDLGQEEWEIIHFHSQPDNLLAFTGLARRSTQRDWTLEDAAAAAARAEADKLRAEFEAKFKSANAQGAAAADEPGETFLAEEKAGVDDGFRRPVDTSRDNDPDAPDEETERDEWDTLSAEDELPTFFEALRPHMRKNQRGPGTSVGVDYLAKKWKLEEADIKSALVECGLQIPADENAKPVYVEFEGDLFWVNINRRGEIWINTREKPQPVFRIVEGKRLTEDEAPPEPALARQSERREREERRPETRPAAESREAAADAREPAESAPVGGSRTFLDRIRGMMRRNRRGHGWSGSFAYLTKALRIDEATLLAQLAEHGVRLKEETDGKPLFHEEGDFLYWMDKNPRGEIWINARKERGQKPDDSGESNAEDSPAESTAGSAPARVPAHTLEAVRLLLQPKKRGDGVAARVPEIAQQLEQTEDALLAALVAVGLNVPEDAKSKPAFAEHAGEIFWLNRNARGELWLNAKESRSSAKRSRGRKKSEAGEDEPTSESPEPPVPPALA